MISQPSPHSGWHKVLNDLNLTATPTATPSNRASGDAPTSDSSWFQALARFARTGFLRVLLAENSAGNVEIYIQVAAGTSPEIPALLTAALASHSQTSWTLHTAEAPFELSTVLPPASDNTAEASTETALRNTLVALMKLGDAIASHADQAELTPADIASALSFTTPGETTRPTPQEQEQAANKPDELPPEHPENTLFETIGTTPSSQTQAGPNIDHTTITQDGNHLRIALHLTILLRPSEHHELANALAHHLRARFDANVTPVPESTDSESLATNHSIIILDAEHSEEAHRNPSGHAELAKSLEAFFQKARQWAELGIDIFELVGLRHATSTPDPIQFTPSHAPASPRTTLEPSFGTAIHSQSPRDSQNAQKPEATESSDNGIVFDLSSQSSRAPSSGGFTSAQTQNRSDALTRGDFTDPRLKRADATTPLVDLVLRHPGYSDRRIGQVLSIILSIDYHAALRLVENAPCVIAWGLARETALNYKDVIDTTGGKALLVEPDTFSER